MIESNKALADEPSLANKAPHGEGWFFKIKMSKPAELAALMDYAAYQATAK